MRRGPPSRRQVYLHSRQQHRHRPPNVSWASLPQGWKMTTATPLITPPLASSLSHPTDHYTPLPLHPPAPRLRTVPLSAPRNLHLQGGGVWVCRCTEKLHQRNVWPSSGSQACQLRCQPHCFTIFFLNQANTSTKTVVVPLVFEYRRSAGALRGWKTVPLFNPPPPGFFFFGKQAEGTALLWKSWGRYTTVTHCISCSNTHVGPCLAALLSTWAQHRAGLSPTASSQQRERRNQASVVYASQLTTLAPRQATWDRAQQGEGQGVEGGVAGEGDR